MAGAGFGLRSSNGLTAFELSGGTLTATLGGFASLSAANIKIQYTSAGATIAAATDDITVGSASYDFTENIVASTISFSLTDLNASVSDFVSLTGGAVGFKLTGTGASTQLIAAGSNLTAKLSAGSAVV